MRRWAQDRFSNAENGTAGLLTDPGPANEHSKKKKKHQGEPQNVDIVDGQSLDLAEVLTKGPAANTKTASQNHAAAPR